MYKNYLISKQLYMYRIPFLKYFILQSDFNQSSVAETLLFEQ